MHGIPQKVAGAELAGVQDVLRFVGTLSDPQAAAIARQLERLVLVEMALRLLVGQVERYLTLFRQPTQYAPDLKKLQEILAEAKARIRG